jgi:hypothetical protein
MVCTQFQGELPTGLLRLDHDDRCAARNLATENGAEANGTAAHYDQIGTCLCIQGAQHGAYSGLNSASERSKVGDICIIWQSDDVPFLRDRVRSE